MKRLLLIVLLLFSFSLFIPKVSRAASLREALTSEDSIVVKIQEGVEYFFAFSVEKKVEVLEKHAEKRLTMAQSNVDQGDTQKVQNLLRKYLQIKEKQNNLLGKTSSEEVLGVVEERTIEQQKTMEEIKTKIDEDVKQEVIQVQEQVVNQVAERVIDVNGSEGTTEFLQKVEHVWASGTGPGGGEAGVVVEGGTIQFAPGTSAGGPAGEDIKNVEVKTGGGDSGGGGGGGDTTTGGLAPGTTSGGGGNSVDVGGVAPGASSGNTETHDVAP
jgi:hypothetical protein